MYFQGWRIDRNRVNFNMRFDLTNQFRLPVRTSYRFDVLYILYTRNDAKCWLLKYYVRLVSAVVFIVPPNRTTLQRVDQNTLVLSLLITLLWNMNIDYCVPNLTLQHARVLIEFCLWWNIISDRISCTVSTFKRQTDTRIRNKKKKKYLNIYVKKKKNTQAWSFDTVPVHYNG